MRPHRCRWKRRSTFSSSTIWPTSGSHSARCSRISTRTSSLVSSGAEALRELLERDFAVIVLDVNMPDIDGIETAELIRKHGRTSHTPIIFVTAYADEMQTERGYELGAVDYILTPVVPAILRSKVRVFVDLYRAQRRAAKVARAEAGRAAGRGGAAQLRSDRAREPRALRVARSRREHGAAARGARAERRRLRRAVRRHGRQRRRSVSAGSRADARRSRRWRCCRRRFGARWTKCRAAAMRSRFASTPTRLGPLAAAAAVRARAAAQGRRAQHRRAGCSARPSTSPRSLDDARLARDRDARRHRVRQRAALQQP